MLGTSEVGYRGRPDAALKSYVSRALPASHKCRSACRVRLVQSGTAIALILRPKSTQAASKFEVSGLGQSGPKDSLQDKISEATAMAPTAVLLVAPTCLGA